MHPGPNNLITDVAGILVGQAEDAGLASGVTAVIGEEPAHAGVDVRGGGPGTRETDLLDPERTVERVDAVVLTGGSAFGLDAASGVQAWLAAHDRGYRLAGMRVPIVPAAVLFDLGNGGDKGWGRYPPYRELGYAAAENAGRSIRLGTAGAGYGANTARLKGGLGSASAITEDGVTVGAIVAVNAVGSATIGDRPNFWAAPFEAGVEFGGLGMPERLQPDDLQLHMKRAALISTTIAVVATDAVLDKRGARRLAVMAQDGLARALRPVHTPLDGDTVFALATGKVPVGDPVHAAARIGETAATVLARAVARGVYEAVALPFARALPAWRDRFGPNRSAR